MNPIHIVSFPTVSLLLLLQTLQINNTSDCRFHYSLHSLAGCKPPFVLWISSRVLPNHSKQISLSAIHSECKSDWFTGHWTFQFQGHSNYQKYAVSEHDHRTALPVLLPLLVQASRGDSAAWIAPACQPCVEIVSPQFGEICNSMQIVLMSLFLWRHTITSQSRNFVKAVNRCNVTYWLSVVKCPEEICGDIYFPSARLTFKTSACNEQRLARVCVPREKHVSAFFKCGE